MRKRIEQERNRLDRLEAFYWTIRLKTEEKAGIKLGLDAGTIRKRNLKLEDAWGEQLLIRNGNFRRSVLTDLGKDVFQIARAHVQAASQAKRQTLKTRLSHALKQKLNRGISADLIKMIKALKPQPQPSSGIRLGFKRNRVIKKKPPK